MKIHEYQAKEICRKYDVSVPRGRPAFSVDQAEAIAQELGYPVVVKAQIHAGGRGKGGGVKLAKNREEAIAHAKAILGMQLVTHQTGPEGKLVQRLLIEEGANIAREFYAGIVLDRERGRNVVMVSTEGGVEIEKVAATTPEKIIKAWVDPAIGFKGYQARQLAFSLGLTGDSMKQAASFLMKLYKMYVDSDASLAEINPSRSSPMDALSPSIANSTSTTMQSIAIPTMPICATCLKKRRLKSKHRNSI